MRAYEITARAPELGGGWNLAFVEDGEEAGGGVFPLAAYEGYARELAAQGDDRPLEEIASGLAYDDALEEGESFTE